MADPEGGRAGWGASDTRAARPAPAHSRPKKPSKITFFPTKKTTMDPKKIIQNPPPPPPPTRSLSAKLRPPGHSPGTPGVDDNHAPALAALGLRLVP